MAAHRPLIDALRTAFAAHAQPTQALAMQAYMKSALPFHGIAAPRRRTLTTAVVQAHPAPSAAALADTMRALWDEAACREERYAASELARQRVHRQWLALPLLPVFEHMLVSGAWWDHADELSSEGIGPLLQQQPQRMKPVLRRWAHGNNLWLRRAAILCQRRLKADCFDAELLYACILPSTGNAALAAEFFLRKGIGWALRERSYRAPAEVQAFCQEYADQLSPLTVREALRVIRRRAALDTSAAS